MVVIRHVHPAAEEDDGAGLAGRHDEDLREPLVRRQGSQVSMRVARRSALELQHPGRREVLRVGSFLQLPDQPTIAASVCVII